MLQDEIQWDQKPEKVQITSKVMNVDRTKDGQSLALGDPQEAGQSAHSVHTSKQKRQAEVQKNPNVSPQVYRRTISRDEGAVTRDEQS